METPIDVISRKYCSPEPMKLIIDTESGLTHNINGELVFRLRKSKNVTLHKRRVLSDSSDNTVLNMSRKICTFHDRRLVFKGDSEDLAFSVKRSSSKCPGKDTINLDVLIPPENTNNRSWDYNVIAGGSGKGFYCRILYCRSSTEVVRMEVAENGDLEVEVKPNFDHAFIVALITFADEEMKFKRIDSKTSKAGQHMQTAIGAVRNNSSIKIRNYSFKLFL